MTQHDEYYEVLARAEPDGRTVSPFLVVPRLCRHLEGRVLDIGCGIGDMLRHRGNTVGVDVNRRAVDWCRKNGLDARSMEPDHLPFGDGEFDGAILDNVLEHLETPDRLLAEARRVLKPRGVLIAGVPGSAGFASDPDHKTFYDAHTLTGSMSKAGFRCERIIQMPLPLRALDRRLTQYCVYGVFRA